MNAAEEAKAETAAEELARREKKRARRKRQRQARARRAAAERLRRFKAEAPERRRAKARRKRAAARERRGCRPPSFDEVLARILADLDDQDARAEAAAQARRRRKRRHKRAAARRAWMAREDTRAETAGAGAARETMAADNTPALITCAIWILFFAAVAFFIAIVHGLYVAVISALVVIRPTGATDSPAEETVAGSCNNLPLPLPLLAPDSSTETPGANAANTAATDMAASALRLDVRLGSHWHTLVFSEAAATTVATLREALLQRLHLRLEACRLVPVPAAGSDLRTEDDTAPLLDVLGACRQLEVLARLCGGGRKNKAAAEGNAETKTKTKKVYTTISGLGLSAHLGPAVPQGRGARDPMTLAAASLKEALESTISDNVAGVSMANIVAVSALYAWVEEMVDGRLDSFDAAAIWNAFGSDKSETSAKAFGNGLYIAALGRSTESGNEKLPAALKDKVAEFRELFLAQSVDAAQQLCTRLRGVDTSLAKALKKALQGQACIGTASSAIAIAAGQSFGVAIRNHWKADAKRAVRRMLFEEVKVDLTKAGLEFNDKVTNLLALFRVSIRLTPRSGCGCCCRVSSEQTHFDREIPVKSGSRRRLLRA